jgi:hypothetical protein
MGFTCKWIDWLSILLSSASMRVILNGNQGDRICHAHGLRQGDPLSPMLFLLAMEVLNALISRADFWSLFKPLAVHGIRHWASLYADDLVVFISPEPQDIQVLYNVRSVFEEAFGLACNLGKC